VLFRSVKQDALSALSWEKYERSCEPCLGAIMVFKRPGGGHVGFYVAEDKEAYHILGGNQSDKVSVARVGKDRHTETRWPNTFPMSKTGRVWTTSKSKLSTNER